MNVEITEKALEEAVKRHEDAFEKELETMTEEEMKKVVLKTKKALLEQARANENVRTTATELNYKVKQFSSKIDRLETELKDTQTMFAEAIRLLKLKEDYKSTSLFQRFKNYWLFWL